MKLAKHTVQFVAAMSLALLCSLAPVAHAEKQISDLSNPVSLHGLWQVQVGDDLAWSSREFNSSDWPQTLVPAHSPRGHTGYSGMLWYRITLRLDLEQASVGENLGALAINIGHVMNAYELFAGGKKIGQLGQLNAPIGSGYDRRVTWPVPATAVDGDGKLVIALRVWRDPSVAERWETGPYSGEYLLGNIGQLTERIMAGTLWPNVPLSLLYLVLGLYHLLIARRNPGLREFAWFGGLCLILAVYTFETSQAKYFIDIPFFWHKKTEFLVLYLSPIFLGKTLLGATQTAENRVVWVFNIVFLLFFASALIAPNTNWLLDSLRAFQYLAALWALVIAAIMAQRAFQGSRSARGIVMLLLLLVAAVFNDVILATPLVGFGNLLYLVFAFMLMGIAVMMAERYTEILNYLEDAVDKRTVELVDSNRALEDALDTKSRFLANMSHEMRTPMNAILGLTRLGLTTDLNDKQRNYFSQVEKSGEELLQLLEKVMNFSNLSGGAISLIDEPFDMPSLLADVHENWAPQAKEAGLAFKLDCAETWPDRLIGDVNLLRQVLDQLLSNAIKFTQEGEVVLSVCVVKRGEGTATVRCSVVDTGIGIEKSERASLFEAFSQVDNSSTRAYGGAGIGLPIVQRILSLMNVSLDVDTQLGGGSTFSFDVIFQVETNPH